MVTKQSTLCTGKVFVSAQQFDDSKWKEQRCKTLHVKEWSPAELTPWANNIEGIRKDISSVLKENEITGREILALKKDGLLMLGITRTGTLCLLLEESKSYRSWSSIVPIALESLWAIFVWSTITRRGSHNIPFCLRPVIHRRIDLRKLRRLL